MATLMLIARLWQVTNDYCSTGGPNPCQQGFGSCEVHAPISCDPSANSALGRSIGYYQGSNVYQRICNQIPPDQIDVSSYTHLNWAFATIDPNTYQVLPATQQDAQLYPAFTNLQATSKTGLRTWISMTGFDFSDNGTATHQTWSNMVSSSANRQAFISGAVAFMNQYGFSGIDLDWEYPVDPARGGRPNDMVNLVQLLADMRASSQFGNKYGISVTLAPDLWYLQHYDAKGLLAHADFLGFMAYVGPPEQKLPEPTLWVMADMSVGPAWHVGQRRDQPWTHRVGPD